MGSTFPATFTGSDFNSNDFTVDVIATQLTFTQQPTNVEINATMSPSVTVAATDANGNIDTGFGSNIGLATSGTNSSFTTPQTPSAGVATFNDIVFSSTQTGITLTASDAAMNLADLESNTFSVIEDLTPTDGSIIFTQFGSDNPNRVEFLLLERLDLSTLGISEDGLCSGGAFRDDENNIEPFTTGFSDVPAGTIVQLENPATPNSDFIDGLIVANYSGSGLSTGGDQVLAYIGTYNGSSSCGSPSATNTLIAGINFSSDWIDTGEPTENTSYVPGTSSDINIGSAENGRFKEVMVEGNASTIRNDITDDLTNDWETSASALNFTLKDILFQASNYTTGTHTVTGATPTTVTIDFSDLTFTNTNSDTRYFITAQIDDAANGSDKVTASDTPTDRYTCYDNVSTTYDLADVVVESTSGQSASNFCGTPSSDSEPDKVVYFDYGLPSSLTITLPAGTDITAPNGDVFFFSVFAVNGNGYTANFGSPYRLIEAQGVQPVNLTYFTADKQGSTVELNWATSSEQNNSHFIIERRANDELTFEPIGKVNGNGTTDRKIDYFFVDEQPLEDINYYRLRQVDFNEDFQYSKVVSVEMPMPHFEVNVFPNPAANELNIQLEGDINSKVIVEVFDMINGRRVMTYEFLDNNTSLNIFELGAGHYILRLSNGAHTVTTKFVKQ